jgi:putative transposase
MQPDTYYHIYNYSNDPEVLFRCDENCRFFLQQYFHFISPIADTFTYCLLPNHFHFLIRLRSLAEISLLQERYPNPARYKTTEQFISRQFSNFFSSYAKAYNKMYQRNGSLMRQNFRRKPIATDQAFRRSVTEIHAYPVLLGHSEQLERWNWSSYALLMSVSDTPLKRSEVLNSFEGLENYLQSHRRMIALNA